MIRYLILSLFFVCIDTSCLLGQDNNSSGISDKREIYRIVDKMPKFPGCELMNWSDKDKDFCTKQKINEFLEENLIYPDSAKMKAVEGFVILQFLITKSGEITDVKIAQDLGYGCGQAAVDAIRSMNNMSQRWTPGENRGRVVDVMYTLPVRFKVNENKSEIIEAVLNQLSENKEKESETGFYTSAQKKPVFPDCRDIKCTDKAVKSFIVQNLIYPNVSKNRKRKGIVKVEFIVSKYGWVRDAKVTKSLGEAYDNEALNVINKLNQQAGLWQPAQHKGEAVNFKKRIDVIFK